MINGLKLILNSINELFEIAPYFKIIIFIILIGISFKFQKWFQKLIYFLIIIALFFVIIFLVK